MEREFDAVHDLIRQSVQTAEEHDDPLVVLTAVARLVVQGEADPYLLLGVLAAAAVATIAEKIPPERQQFAGAAFRQMLADQLKRQDIA